MFYDLTNPTLKADLETLIRDWLADAKTIHDSMNIEWDEADQYYENEQVPSGFTDRHKDVLADVNDPSKPSTKHKQYVVVNKVRESHENILGDFIGARKSIQVRGRSYKDKKIGNAIKAQINHIEDEIELWDRVMVPVIDNTILRGLDWVKIRFNPFKNIPYGKIEVERVSCRDVLIDPNTIDQFMEDTKYRIHREEMSVKDANKRFGEYLGGLSFGPDSEAQQSHTRRGARPTHEQYCTIYEIQYVELECDYYHQDPKTGKQTQIDEEEFYRLSNTFGVKAPIFKVERTQFYQALYNSGVGVFYNEELQPNAWGIIPSINIKRESRAYPFGDAIYYRNLQDLLNVLMSVALENAKKGNNPIVGVDPASYAKWATKINEALNSPGTKALPASTLSVHYPRELNVAVINLLQLAEKFIYDLSAKHAASRGELPTQQIAERTVNMLIAQDRQSHGRKDVTIRWTMTQIAKIFYRIAAENFTEEHWVRLTDQKVGDPEFVPINFRLTEEEYQDFILSVMGVDMKAVESAATTPEGREALQEARAAVARFVADFERTNEVQRIPDISYKLSDGRVLNGEQMQEELKKLKIDFEQYKARYGAQEVQNTLVVINDLSSDPDVDVRYEIDFNFEQDRVARQNRALTLAQMGAITPRRLLHELEFPDADEAAREAEAFNQALALGKQIIEDQELYAQVLTVMNGLRRVA